MAVHHHPWLHRNLLRLQGCLHILLVLLNGCLDVCVEVDIDPLLALLDLHTEEGSEVLCQRDVKIPGIFSDEFLL